MVDASTDRLQVDDRHNQVAGGMHFFARHFSIAVAMYCRHTFHAAAIAEGQTLQTMASGNMPTDTVDPDCARPQRPPRRSLSRTEEEAIAGRTGEKYSQNWKSFR